MQCKRTRELPEALMKQVRHCNSFAFVPHMSWQGAQRSALEAHRYPQMRLPHLSNRCEVGEVVTSCPLSLPQGALLLRRFLDRTDMPPALGQQGSGTGRTWLLVIAVITATTQAQPLSPQH